MTSLLVCLTSMHSKVATLTQINSLSAIFPYEFSVTLVKYIGIAVFTRLRHFNAITSISGSAEEANKSLLRTFQFHYDETCRSTRERLSRMNLELTYKRCSEKEMLIKNFFFNFSTSTFVSLSSAPLWPGHIMEELMSLIRRCSISGIIWY